MNMLDAFALAARLHAGQADKAGAPYIGHPVRVMLRLPGDATVLERMAALLHDVLEDCPGGREELLAAGAPPDLMVMLEALCKIPGEEYEDYLVRVARSPAVRVKLADIADNADPARLAVLPPAVAEMLARKYELAAEIIKLNKE